jgi:hypothetical protein
MTPPFELVRNVFNQGSLLYGFMFKGARDLIKLPVASRQTILRGMFVGNVRDEAIVATDDTGYTFVGVAAANPYKGFVYVWRKGFFKFPATGIDGIDAGVDMMVATSTTIDNSSVNSVKAGRLVKNVSDTVGWIELNVDAIPSPPA